MQLHDGHAIYLQPQEERFVTPELIRHTTMTAAPAGLLSRLRALEPEGARQVAFIPTPASLERFAREFSEKIIAKFRPRQGSLSFDLEALDQDGIGSRDLKGVLRD